MRLITYCFQLSKAIYQWYVKGQHTDARPAVHLKDILDRLELTHGGLLGITTSNTSWNSSMTGNLQTILEASRILWPALRNHIPCVKHVIHLALGVFMIRLGVKCLTKSWEAHERDQQFGENESITIGQCQRLRKEGIATINEVSAMRLGLAKVIEKVSISRCCESTETDHHIVENAACIDYANTRLSKGVHWLSNSQSPHCGTT